MWDDLLFRLRAARVRATFEAAGTGLSPSFAGAAWRGALGASLRSASCSTGASTCAGCPVAQDCTYGYVFETPVPAGARRLRLYPNAPHPFVLRVASPEGDLETGQRVEVELCLFGSGVRRMDAVVEALRQAGERGIGPDRVVMNLVRLGVTKDRGLLADLVDADPALGDTPADVTLRFRSPVRIVYGGALTRSLPLHVVVRSLLRRVSSLMSFHEDIELALDFAGLIRRAQEVETASEHLEWRDQWRRSARQGAAHTLGGLVGEVTYRQVPAELRTLLGVGAIVQIGKGVSFGLGHYDCEAANDEVPARTPWAHRSVSLEGAP